MVVDAQQLSTRYRLALSIRVRTTNTLAESSSHCVCVSRHHDLAGSNHPVQQEQVSMHWNGKYHTTSFRYLASARHPIVIFYHDDPKNTQQIVADSGWILITVWFLGWYEPWLVVIFNVALACVRHCESRERGIRRSSCLRSRSARWRRGFWWVFEGIALHLQGLLEGKRVC